MSIEKWRACKMMKVVGFNRIIVRISQSQQGINMFVLLLCVNYTQPEWGRQKWLRIWVDYM